MGSDAVMASAYFYYLVALATVVLMSAASPITFGEADVAESETDINSFVPEMELASAAEAVETERTRHIVANIIKSGHNIDVPVNQLQVNSKWLPHQLVKPFFRIDIANKYICWPTSCKKAKCGPNTPVNAAIAKKQVAKLSKAGCLAEKFKREMKKVKSEQMNAKVKAVAGKRNKIADNYLSLKAYAISAKDRVIDYRGKKKGSLSSVGDLLATLGALDSVKIRAAPGLGLGGGKSPPLFAGKKVKQAKSLSKINGLANEFTRSVGQVRMRWPLGLGKYLLDKLEESMMTRGALEVDKIAGKRGNFVYINGRSVGLSNKLNDFSKLSSGMSAYESTLAKLTAQLTKSSKGKKPAGKIVVKPPEWQGK